MRRQERKSLVAQAAPWRAFCLAAKRDWKIQMERLWYRAVEFAWWREAQWVTLEALSCRLRRLAVCSRMLRALEEV
jgi:hypothetical protein